MIQRYNDKSALYYGFVFCEDNKGKMLKGARSCYLMIYYYYYYNEVPINNWKKNCIYIFFFYPTLYILLFTIRTDDIYRQIRKVDKTICRNSCKQLNVFTFC
jgi:hypothetical protein